MYFRLPFSPTRVIGGLAIAIPISLAGAVAIYASGAKVWPLAELAACGGIAGVLALAAPHMRSWTTLRGLMSLAQRPRSAHLKAVRDLLFAPRKLQFSVQAGLIYLSVMCLWLSLSVNRLHRLDAAARAVELAGGRVVYDGPRVFGEVRTVAIARRDAPADDVTLLGLIPHIRSLAPRRIVIGSLASSTVVSEIEAALPSAEIVIRGSGGGGTSGSAGR